MKQCSLLVVFFLSFLFTIAQNVGIGTTTPHNSALLHVDAGTSTNLGLLVTGTFTGGPSSVPNLGTGLRLMYYPAKGAFRAGLSLFDRWDDGSVGNYSMATGYATMASGEASTALGLSSNATGYGSFAVGNGAVASGQHSIALGVGATANGNYSVALGSNVTTSGHSGAFVLGDNSGTTVMGSFVANGFRSRFAGGYRLLSNSNADIGVVLGASGNSWSAISDARLKENFLPVNGEAVLAKIAAMPQTTWNYISQEDKRDRHYGPMAQDFHAAFGKDNLGEIGCDTLINQQDFLGVNLIAIQALEKRTATLQKENEALKARLEKLEKLVAIKQ